MGRKPKRKEEEKNKQNNGQNRRIKTINHWKIIFVTIITGLECDRLASVPHCIDVDECLGGKNHSKSYFSGISKYSSQSRLSVLDILVPQIIMM